MTTTKIATSNIKRGVGWSGLQPAALRLVDRGVDIIGFQEVIGARQKRLRKLMARKGYGLAHSWESPIAYDLKRYKLVKHDSRQLGGKGTSGPGNPTRFGNYVALKDKKTGQITVVTNTHLGRHRNSHELNLARRQARALTKMQADLRDTFGPDADYYVTGDMNTARALHLHLKNHHGQGEPIDRILTNRRMIGSHLMQTASDHDTFIGTFRSGKGGGHHQQHGIDNPGDGHGGGKGGNHGGPHGNYGGPHNGGNGNGSNFDQGAFDLFSDLLESWGIPVGSDIEKIIKDAMVEGRTPDQIELLIPDIQNTDSWKKRFPGWSQRVANGYNQLSVNDYLNLENQYHRIMQDAGLPAGFYDDPSDFGNWIANDVSPDEIQNRVSLAVTTAKSVDKTARNLMAKFYGLSTGDVASYFLDQERALPVIERQFNASQVAAYASRAGFDVKNMRHYEGLVDDGVTAQQAAQSYGTVKSLADTAGALAKIYGDDYNQGDAERDVFFGKSEKRQKIFEKERASFGGSSRGATGSAQRNGY